MNKKLLLPLLLLVAAPIAADQYFQSKVSKEVTAFLANEEHPYTFTVDNIDYSFFTKNLVLSGIHATDYNGPAFNIDKFTIDGYSTKAFDAKSGDYPLVAKELLLEGFKSVDETLSIENISVKGWKQNLGLLKQAVDNEDFEAYLHQFIKFNLDSLEVNNLKNFEDTSLTKLYLNPKEDSTYDLEVKELLIDDGYMLASVGEIKVENGITPSEEALANLVTLTLSSGSTISDIEDLYQSLTPAFTGALASATKEQKANVKDIVVAEYSETLFTIDEITQITKAGGLEGTFNINDFAIPTAFDSEMQELMQTKELTMDISGNVKMNKDLTNFTFDTLTEVEDFADFTVATDILLPMPYSEFVTGLAQEDFMTIMAMLEAKINDFTFNYTDDGLVARLIITAQEEFARYSDDTISIDDVINEAKGMIVSLEEEMYYFGLPEEFSVPFAQALENNLEIPGKIDFKLTAKGATINQISEQFMMENKIPLSVVYTAGSKTTKELVEEIQTSAAQAKEVTTETAEEAVEEAKN